MTKRTLAGGLVAAMLVAGCGGSASTTGSLPDSASTYAVTSGFKTGNNNGNSNNNGNNNGNGADQGTNPVVFSGQGLPMQELCGKVNGAEVDGPYLLWVFTAAQADSATITGPWGTAAMSQEPGGNGTFKYISDYTDPSTLIGKVSATYVGDAKNPQLVLSHGCSKKGAWCSPGFWKNAEDAAWTVTGVGRTDAFNTTVYDYFYGATFTEDPSLETVLGTKGGTYKGAPNPGTSGFALNAFNATGAFLTDNIPGYQFSWDLMQADSDTEDDSDDPCPLDHHGNFKVTSP